MRIKDSGAYMMPSEPTTPIMNEDIKKMVISEST
jgi:hypothetical protein